MHMDVNTAYGKLDNSKDTEIITTENEAYGHWKCTLKLIQLMVN